MWWSVFYNGMCFYCRKWGLHVDQILCSSLVNNWIFIEYNKDIMLKVWSLKKQHPASFFFLPEKQKKKKEIQTLILPISSKLSLWAHQKFGKLPSVMKIFIFFTLAPIFFGKSPNIVENFTFLSVFFPYIPSPAWPSRTNWSLLSGAESDFYITGKHTHSADCCTSLLNNFFIVHL